MRENRQMTNKKLYCEDVLQMLFADSEKGNICGLEMAIVADDRPRLHLSFFLITRAQSAAGRQYRCSQCWVTLGVCAVPCNKRYHTLKNYKRSPRYLIGQIVGQLLKNSYFSMYKIHKMYFTMAQ